MIDIRYFGAVSEATACQAFLHWQQRSAPVRHDSSILGITRGHPGVVISGLAPDRDIIGFFDMVDWMKSTGSILC